ncbi:MAG: TrkH family potassium uptake protein [Candidatus Ozemobacteraceae bacterium]
MSLVRDSSRLTERCEKFSVKVTQALNVVAFFGLFLVLFEPSLGGNYWFQWAIAVTTEPIYGIFLLHLCLAFLLAPSIYSFLQGNLLDLLFFVPLFTISFGGVHPAHIFLVRQFVYYFNCYLEESTFSHLANAISERPARLISFSFLGVILTGAFLLVLPVSIAQGQQPSLLTALFTSTSAVCVTGLNVVDPGSYFSRFGQIVVMGLIQIGGLGIMTLSAGVMMLVGKRMAITQRTVMQNVLDQTDLASLRNMLWQILKWTFIIESIGAIFLSWRFCVSNSQYSLSYGIYLGVFHAVSAFCNAGFTLFPDNLMSFSGDFAVNMTVMSLIVCGGLGFSVLSAMNGYFLGNRRGPADVHTRLVLITTVFLIFAGAFGIFLLEAGNSTWAHLTLGEKVMAAFFQSVTTRTAGFNTVDMGVLKESTLFFMIILMFIGASPASTGGGIKTTTFAIMVLTLISQMQGKPQVVIFGRTITGEIIVKAFLITAISASLVGVFSFLLLLTENQPLSKLMFEVTSAFGTVGLSANLTPLLGSLSRILIIILMYIGRIGPLTLALSFMNPPARGDIQYPAARVLVG